MQTDTKTKSEVVFFIDQQKFKLEDREYTPRELLVLAGEDPQETTLVRRHGNELVKLTDLDQKVRIEDGTHFVVFHNGPTPVS
jgi:multiubiquitin